MGFLQQRVVTVDGFRVGLDMLSSTKIGTPEELACPPLFVVGHELIEGINPVPGYILYTLDKDLMTSKHLCVKPVAFAYSVEAAKWKAVKLSHLWTKLSLIIPIGYNHGRYYLHPTIGNRVLKPVKPIYYEKDYPTWEIQDSPEPTFMEWQDILDLHSEAIGKPKTSLDLLEEAHKQELIALLTPINEKNDEFIFLGNR